MMLEIRVLGAVEAWVDGQSLPLGGAKQRALLARLAMARGRALTAARLCEELWEDSQPRDPTHALQARISRLRAAIPSEIHHGNGGYRLDPAGIDCDAERFAERCERGRSQLAVGDLAQAAESLRAALALWRGPAFADVPGISALRAEAARLDDDRARALAERIDIDLALGRAESLVPELSSLVTARPAAERHWGQLMLALYATGRVQDALRAFERARGQFTARSGADSGDALQQLHLAILREVPAAQLLRAPGALRPGALAAAPGALRGDESRITSNQDAALATRLGGGQALLVTGPSGIGKTHLLRSVRARSLAADREVSLLTGNALGREVPFGAFAGIDPQLAAGLDSAAALIDHFVRRRSHIALLVDDVHLLDAPSLFVVTQMIRTSQIAIILSAPDLTTAPLEVRALYDSGELVEMPVDGLSDAETHDLAVHLVGGPLTPDARARLLSAASGNPMHLREIIDGSRAGGVLVAGEHGWGLSGELTPTPRLAQLLDERFADLDEASIDAAMRVAIAGEIPADAIDEQPRRALARTDLISSTADGWLRLAHPMDREVLRRRSSDLHWRELTRDVVRLLRGPSAATHPQAKLRADVLSLELDGPIDLVATLALAERALAAFDEPLAMRAASAIVQREPTHGAAHRVLGLAASATAQPAVAERHFGIAAEHASTDAERAAVALAHAQHRGLRQHDAAGALHIIAATRERITDGIHSAHLARAEMRWSAVAGLGGLSAPDPALTADAAGALGLITVGVSGVITGPLVEADRVLAQLRRVPADIIGTIPGGAALVELTEVMALSYSGDVIATQQQLRRRIAEARARAPETVGMWEYAHGFTELLSGDAARAHTIASAAVSHLRWRDTTGLVPAAHALAGAAAAALGRATESRHAFEAIAESAAGDPKVVMLRGWTNARLAHAAGGSAAAARTLLETADQLLAAQHTYFAGMLANCAMRTGHLGAQARERIAEAARVAGGGLLDWFVRHAAAQAAADPFGLDVVAREARELGMVSAARDAWASFLRVAADPSLIDARRRSIEELVAQHPAMATWTP